MTETERKAFYIRLINGVLIFLFVLTGLIVATYIKDDWISPRTLYVEELDDGWTRVNEDGSRKIVSGNFSIGNSGPVTFYRILPDMIEDDKILRFTCTFRTVDATVNGKNIYHAGPAKFGPISTSVGNLFALIPMSSDYSGQEIYITVEPRHYFYDVTVQDAAITTMASYSLERIAESVPYLCLCVIILAISIISFFMYIGFKFAPTDSERTISKGFFHLFVFGISAICWIISDFHVAGMLTGRMALSGVINYISFMICPIMFSGVLIYIFDNRLFFRILFIISEANFLIQIVLFLTGIMDLPQGLMASQFLIILMVAGIVVFGVTMIKRFASTGIIVLVIPTFCFVLCTLAGSITYIRNGKWMFYVALALTFYSFTVITYLFLNLWNALKNNMELEHMRQIAYMDNMTHLENRRSYDEYVAELNEKIEKGEMEKTLFVIMLDVNGLKKTNDIFGHTAGDELITGSAECILLVFGDCARCFRTGGDEFVVITDIERAEFLKRSEELEDIITHWSGDSVDEISISIGMTDSEEFPDYNAEKLLEVADSRMYENKQKYYALQLAETTTYERAHKDAPGDHNGTRYLDNFSLTKYTMPIIKQIAEVIPGGFFIYREDEIRELLYLNHTVLKIFGCRTVDEFKELTGYTFEGMVYPDDFHSIQNSIDNQIESIDSDAMDHVIYRIVRKDGQIRWVDDYGHFSRSSDYGDIYYVFINDITDQMQNL